MKTIRIAQVPQQPQQSALFTGPTAMQDVVGPGMSDHFLIKQVNFGLGVRNKFHTHTADQILIVTAGKGLVATEGEVVSVAPGEVVFIPAGEKHWHGAAESSTFSHLFVTSPSNKTAQLEE